MKVRLFKPSVGEEELQSIRESFDRGWIGLGEKTKIFEEKWTEWIGCEEAVGVNSCTAALHLALSVFKFPQGKKVLVPVMTFAATAMAPIYNGLEPVFVDCDPDTLSINMEDLKKKYDKDCVAVIVVHFAGHPAPIDEIINWASERNLKVIEDCAHTAGGTYKGKKLGLWGDIGCYSFEEKKCMTTGDGGMICSNTTGLLAPLRHTRWVGMNKDTWEREKENLDATSYNQWYYEILDIGYKYNMNDLMAAIGLVQLEKLPKMNQKRMNIIAQYHEVVKTLNTVQEALSYNLNQECYWMYAVRVKNRGEFIKVLNDKGIATGVHYMPLTLHPYFEKYANDTPIAYRVWKELVTIPLHPDLEPEEVEAVIEAIRSYEEENQ